MSKSMRNLILAVPSKGRLEEDTATLFKAAGMKLKRAGARGYTGKLAGIENVEVAYLSASEIATRLRDGTVHFGITGEDLLREEVVDLESRIQLVSKLGFGAADVVVAIPDGWIDVSNMEDLAEVAGEFRARHGYLMRVATKYVNLAREFFARNGLNDYQIVKSFGATEGAPASGAAEIIVDITSTGATLTANQLRIPEDGVILQSEANLAASLTADWSSEARQAAKQILALLNATRTARNMLEVSFNPHDETLIARLEDDAALDCVITQKIAAPDSKNGQLACTLLIGEENLQPLLALLETSGTGTGAGNGAGTGAVVRKIDYYFTAENGLFNKLLARLPL